MSDSDFEAPQPPRRKKARKKAAKHSLAVPLVRTAMSVEPGLGAGADGDVCVVCGCSTRGWTIMDHQVHLNRCLDRHVSGAGAHAAASASRIAVTSVIASGTSAAFACPICAKSIGRLTLARREEHINRCLDTAHAGGGRGGRGEPAAARRARPAAKPGLVCFMCEKSLARMARGSQTTHLKTCAQQRGVSTADLIAWRRSVDAPPSSAGDGTNGGRSRRSNAAPKQRRSAMRTKAASAARLIVGRGADEIRNRIAELDTEIATRAALRTELIGALAQKEREVHNAARNARNAPLTLADAIAAAGFSPPASPRGDSLTGINDAAAAAAAAAAGGGGGGAAAAESGTYVKRRAAGLSRKESGLSAWAMAGAGNMLNGVALSQTKFQTKFDVAGALDNGDSSGSSSSSSGSSEEHGDVEEAKAEAVVADAMGDGELLLFPVIFHTNPADNLTRPSYICNGRGE